MASVDWVGQDLQCTLKGSGDVIQGQVFTYDKASDSLVLKDHSIKDMANYRFLKGSLIEPSSVKLSGNTAAPDLKDIPVVSDSTIERSGSFLLQFPFDLAWFGSSLRRTGKQLSRIPPCTSSAMSVTTATKLHTHLPCSFWRIDTLELSRQLDCSFMQL